MEPIVTPQLGVKRDGRRARPWRAATGWPSSSARISTSGTVLGDPRRADEHRPQRASLDPSHRRGRPRNCATDGRTRCARQDVHDPEVLAVEHDQPGTEPRIGSPPSHRPPPRRELAQRLGQPLALDARASSWSTPRRETPVPPDRPGRRGTRTSRTCGTKTAQHAPVRLEVALQREHADQTARRATSRVGPGAARRPALSSPG